MADDYMSSAVDEAMEESLANGSMKAVFALGFKAGYEKGLENGFVLGVASEQTRLKSAVSDGLRNSSSECAKVLPSLG